LKRTTKDVPSLVFTITTKKLPASYTEFSYGYFFEFFWQEGEGKNQKISQMVSSLNSFGKREKE